MNVGIDILNKSAYFSETKIQNFTMGRFYDFTHRRKSLKLTRPWSFRIDADITMIVLHRMRTVSRAADKMQANTRLWGRHHRIRISHSLPLAVELCSSLITVELVATSSSALVSCETPSRGRKHDVIVGEWGHSQRPDVQRVWTQVL